MTSEHPTGVSSTVGAWDLEEKGEKGGKLAKIMTPATGGKG